MVISDLHLAEFDGRLGKYLELAEQLANECRSNGIRQLIIAGDTIDKSVTSPRVIHTLVDFVNILNQAGVQVSYILGQHDYNRKNITDDLSNTYLGLLDNMKYVGNTHMDIEGVDVYFKDYEACTEIIPEKCDLLISHITLDAAFGQRVDESKFDLCICGDIHKPINIGKCYSISPPMQIHPSEPQQGYYMYLEFDHGKVTHERRELPIIFQLEKPARLVSIDKIKVEYDDYVIPDNIRDLLDLSDMPEVIDLNYKLIRMDIEDFRCIKSYHIDFDSGVTFISGVNGSGKTTIMDAIYTTFVKTRGNQYTKLEIEFQYKDSTWILNRGANKIFKDGVEMEYKSKNDFEDLIVRLFPFVTLLEFFYVKTYKHFFDCNRIRLFEELFDLKSYAYITQKTKALLRTLEIKARSNELARTSTQGQIDALKEVVIDLELDRDSVITEIAERESWNNKIATLMGTKSAYDSRIINLQTKISKELLTEDELMADNKLRQERDSLVRLINSTKSTIVKCPNCSFIISGTDTSELEAKLAAMDKPKYDLSFINTQLALIRSRYDDVIELEKVKADLTKATNRIAELQSRVDDARLAECRNLLANYDRNQMAKDKLRVLMAESIELVQECLENNERIKSCKDLLPQVDIKDPCSIPVARIGAIVKLIETDSIKFSVFTERCNGSEKLDIQVVEDGIPYDHRSHGEKCMLDLHLLACITQSMGRVGLVLLDEALCTLSESNYNKASGIIKEISANDIVITSHQLGFNGYDREISL